MMKLIALALILIHHHIHLAHSQQIKPYRYGFSIRAAGTLNNSSDVRSTSCTKTTCGTGAVCYEINGAKPVCTCPFGQRGNPLERCYKGECGESEDCKDNQVCESSICINPCIGYCGLGARCVVSDHIPTCSCPENFKGDPKVQCIPRNPCESNPCGLNTKCDATDTDEPNCSCLPTFQGDPYTGCTHECEIDSECGPQDFCSEFKCIKSCSKCGKGASCSNVANHQPKCECPKGFKGSPFTECKPECSTNSDCSSSKSVCSKGICTNPCDGACGVYADCKLKNSKPVCSCLPTYIGDPKTGCRHECEENADCGSQEYCQNFKCSESCNKCGAGAICTDVIDHRATCECPDGFLGTPYTECTPECYANSDCPETRPSCDGGVCIDPCAGACGENTECFYSQSLSPICSCLPTFIGNANFGCTHECENDNECGAYEYCNNFKCQRSCSQCGKGASCLIVVNHTAICECPLGFNGSPYNECRPECTVDTDCPQSKPACSQGICKNPCENACGENAECRPYKNMFVICLCPGGYSGDPFVRCQKMNLCQLGLCGRNAICELSYDRAQREQAICSCPPGYTGDAFKECSRGECLADNECEDDQICLGSKCESVCTAKCGNGAVCKGREHKATCVCPEGTFGDAMVSCRLPRSFAVAKYLFGNRK